MIYFSPNVHGFVSNCKRCSVTFWLKSFGLSMSGTIAFPILLSIRPGPLCSMGEKCTSGH